MSTPIPRTLRCPHCGQVMPQRTEELSARCVGCGMRFEVPDEATEEATEVTLITAAPPPIPVPLHDPVLDAMASSPSARHWGPVRPVPAPVPIDARAAASPREYLYLALMLALVPLAVSVLVPERQTLEDRLEAAAERAGPEVETRFREVADREEVRLDDLLGVLPGGRLDELAHLPRSSRLHWLYGAAAASGAWLLALGMFPAERRAPWRLLRVGLFTGTIGIVLLLAFQLAAAVTQGFWLRGTSVFVVLFYVVKFIGWSYASATAADSNLVLSLVGFVFGVGLCEEVCKALPLLYRFRSDGGLGWRGAATWGLVSGAGFGVAEGILYAGDSYNGIAPALLYVVRFVSCVALHALWTGAAGIRLWKVQDSVWIDAEGSAYAWAVLKALAVPMLLHGLYDTLLKKDLDAGALAMGFATFGWFVFQVESARARERREQAADPADAVVPA